MDWEFITEHTSEFIHAGILTLKIGSIGIVLSIIVGIIGSWILYENFKFFKSIVICYIELSRNTPLLVQLFFLYFGLPKIGLKFSPEICGIIGLTFLGGSYMIETFRSALETIDKIQKESAMSLGLNKWQTMRYVILPQSFVISLPGITANIIFLLKETSVFSAIALVDMMFITKDLIGLYYKTEESLFMLVLGYLIILLPLSLFGVYLERRLKYVGYSN
ncbi:amino acid ABC transporter permease [Fusobacterium massiliense]|uniref:amino acid ABC transporter permease n=1 Tax=Fusobacterium massiliense TaxID=1852365 RepID=UPI0028D1038D|nr:amino acid ABC transporter permease [Fusobacterium massiliense]